MMRVGMTLVTTALLLHGIGAQAASLDKEVCAKLKDEQAQLEQVGLRATMSKGPVWAKTNLAPDKMEQVRRLIEVDEQLTFRCQGKPLVLLPSSVDADPVATVEGEEKDAEGNPIPGKAGPAKEDKAPAVKKAAVTKTDKPPEAKAEPAKKAADPAKKAPAKAPEAKQTKDAAATGQGDPAKAAAKPKAAPKKRPDDAYKPPQQDSGNSPFGSPNFTTK